MGLRLPTEARRRVVDVSKSKVVGDFSDFWHCIGRLIKDMGTVFQLEPFVVHSDTYERLPTLAPVHPRFHLPSLDECESSVDRLLAGLKFRSSPITKRNRSISPSIITDKGKGKEQLVAPEEGLIGPELETAGAEDVSFWLKAGDDEPGPSTGRFFKVGWIASARFALTR